MKLQNFTIIFIMIMLPIILVVSLYISNSIRTIQFQASYDEALLTAANDAVYAFEKNSANEDLFKNPEVKRTLVKSSIEMFKTGLVNSYGISNYSSEEIEEYIPAVVFGMHDGFYVYAPSDLTDFTPGPSATTAEKYEHNLKNYVYYSETLEGLGKNDTDIVIIYSLDNFVTVCGDLGHPEGYQIKSGYLSAIKTGEADGAKYQGITINDESNLGSTEAVKRKKLF